MGLFDSIRKGLSKTRESIAAEVRGIVGIGRLTEERLEELEEQLIRADVGVEVAFRMVDTLRENALGKSLSESEAMSLLAEVADNLLEERKEPVPHKGLHVILVIGVNGSGKTTTIGKLAHRYRAEGKKVLIAAADTFRAAAIEQLQSWAERSGAEFVKHQEGSDPASVVYDACDAAISRKCDVLLIDTAGRLHNKEHLMEELRKIVRIMRKHDEVFPHESWLVIDGTTGQNTINQAKAFAKSFPLTGLVVTKLDGTSRGGSVLSISKEVRLPIQWLGVGEKLDDLVPFSKAAFLDGLFAPAETA